MRLATTMRRMLGSEPPSSPAAPGEVSEYQTKVQGELQFFKDVVEINDLSAIFSYWSNKYIRPMMEEYGFTLAEELFAKYLAVAAKATGKEMPRFLSIGAGNCDAEVRVAQLLREAGVSRFVLECLDMNPSMLQRGRERAAEAGLKKHLAFVEGDFNNWKATKQYAGVMANQSLHHVLELERLFDEIKRSLRPDGYFVTSDMIGRNGHVRWPEAMREVQRFWRELPVEYRWNTLLQRHEEEHLDHDCSSIGFEGIRSQDVLPLLVERFDFRLFIAFGNVINPFVDRTFGPNFDPASEWDREFIDRVHAFDEAAILSGALTPTQMTAVMTTTPCGEPEYSRGLTPVRAIRRANRPDIDGNGIAPQFVIATTSLAPLEKGGIEYGQSLIAECGTPPYAWSATGLPPGLTLARDGVLSGRLRSRGTFTPTIVVADSAPTPQQAMQRYTILSKNNFPLQLEVISPAELPRGIAGARYVQPVCAVGGIPPYAWRVSRGTLPEGLNLESSSGFILGTPSTQAVAAVTIEVTDTTAEIASHACSIAIEPAADELRLGSFPQVACGTGWKTSFYLTNASPSELFITIQFRADDGTALALPLKIESKTLNAARVSQMMAPYSSLDIETDAIGKDLSGWAELSSNGPVTGYCVFRLLGSSSVPAQLELGRYSSFALPYDHTDSSQTAVAIANLIETEPVSIVISIWDEAWAPLGFSTIDLPAGGHASFMLAERFRTTAGKRGLVEFRTNSGEAITGLGLRFSPGGSFTSVPKLLQKSRV